ncbi:MAG: flagellar assembly protein FliW [Alphaproteobacteria bacterium]|nr:flagellar assembly protein FliW [Alphaproteobacteria bacterium]
MAKEALRITETKTIERQASAPEASGYVRTLNTRFGEVTVDVRKASYYPYGLLGFADCHQFCLTHIPSQQSSNFKLLQATEEDAVSFIVLPITKENPFIAAEDIKNTAEILGIKEEDLAILLVVSSSQSEEQSHIGVNLRAPIFMDTTRNLAVQYVFRDSKYPVSFKLK